MKIKAINTPIDSLPFSLLRITYGFIVFWHISHRFIADKVYLFFASSPFKIAFPLIGPLPILSPNTILYAHILLLIASIMVCIGYRYKTAIYSTVSIYTYFFLYDAAFYNNHYYLLIFTGCLLAISPAQDYLSIDALRNKNQIKKTMPYWPLLLLKIQLICMYTFAGLAKANSPDWLEGLPLSIWLAPYQAHSILNSLATKHMAIILSWSALLFDCFIGLLLILPKSRKWAIRLCIIFHLANHFIIFTPYTHSGIGVFPTFAILLTYICFTPPKTHKKQVIKWLT